MGQPSGPSCPQLPSSIPPHARPQVHARWAAQQCCSTPCTHSRCPSRWRPTRPSSPWPRHEHDDDATVPSCLNHFKVTARPWPISCTSCAPHNQHATHSNAHQLDHEGAHHKVGHAESGQGHTLPGDVGAPRNHTQRKGRVLPWGAPCSSRCLPADLCSSTALLVPSAKVARGRRTGQPRAKH